MICPTCQNEQVNVRGHIDCACNPASAELVQKEIARIQRGAKLIVVHVLAAARFYRARGMGCHVWSTKRADAEQYDSAPAGGPWDLRDSDDPRI